MSGTVEYRRQTTVSKVAPVGPPSFLTSDGNSIAWYMVGDGSSTYLTLNGTDAVEFKNILGVNYYLSNADGSDVPQYDSVNGEIDFDGSADFYWDNDSFTAQNKATLYLVFKATFTAYDKFLKLMDSFTIGYSNENKINVYDGTNTIISSGTITDNTYYILRVVLGGTTSNGSKIQINEDTPTTGTLTSNTFTGIMMGVQGAYPLMSVKEYIVRKEVDTEENQTAVVNYLNTKYSIY